MHYDFITLFFIIKTLNDYSLWSYGMFHLDFKIEKIVLKFWNVTTNIEITYLKIFDYNKIFYLALQIMLYI